ncbi:MAG: ThuA domain-containing protein [Planctomycetia bacterium]|nr:ThuA domain-containing protein [Planctomycetia bacterium]
MGWSSSLFISVSFRVFRGQNQKQFDESKSSRLLEQGSASMNVILQPIARTFLRMTLSALLIAVVHVGSLPADEQQLAATQTQHLLLIGQGPDGSHARTTHEYFAGMNLLAKLLRSQSKLETIIVSADGDWRDGPQLLGRADAVVVFVAEGAKWVSADAARLTAFRELAKRGGGLVALHWATGTKSAEPIEPFVSLFGACHGGPDRQFKVLDVTPVLTNESHPILRGVKPVVVHEEFYFALKLAARDGGVTRSEAESAITPLLRIPVAGEHPAVAWSWERPDGGRSCGFTGLHFHDNWKHESYRRLMAQATLWSLKREIPADGIAVVVDAEALSLPDSKMSSN